MPTNPGESAARSPTSRCILGVTLAFELGLGVLAVALALLFGLHPWLDLYWHGGLIPITLIATLPMTGMIALVMRSQRNWAEDLRRLVDEKLLPAFYGMHWWGTGLISVSAGIGEELLFRGVVQNGLGGIAGMFAALLATSLLFGLVHALTPAYFMLTTLAGLYLGGLYMATDNLLLPILVHFLYDWIALSWLISRSLPGYYRGACPRR